MSQFDLEYLKVKPKATAEIELYEIPWEPTPVLVVRPANGSNPDYNNASLKHLARLREASGGTIGHRELAQHLEIDRDLYGRTVVVGWRNVRDKDGKEVPFTPVEAMEFVNELPDQIIERVRVFCQNHKNFLDSIDGPVLEGNSESGSDSD